MYNWDASKTLNFVFKIAFAFGMQALFMHCQREQDLETCVTEASNNILLSY